jgi:hypothetical protein
MEYTDVAVVALIAIAVAVVGAMISYPPYARLAGVTVFVAGLALLALRENDHERVGEKRLEGDSGKGPKSAGKDLVKTEAKGKERDGKKSRKTKTKRK